MNRADRYLIAGVLFVALLSMAYMYYGTFSPSTGNGGIAVIKVRGKPVRRIVLADENKAFSFDVRGKMGYATVVVEGKRIRMSEAPCPDRICVGRGWIEKPGDSIVCIPNEMEIHIEGGASYDAVTR